MLLLKESGGYSMIEDGVVESVGEDKFWTLKNAGVIVIGWAGSDKGYPGKDFIMRFPDGVERAVSYKDLSRFARLLQDDARKNAVRLCKTIKW